MISVHLTKALEELSKARVEKEKELIVLDTQIRELSKIMGTTPVLRSIQGVNLKRRETNTFLKPPTNETPLGLRLREILFDGIPRTVAEIIQIMYGETKTSQAEYSMVANKLRKMAIDHVISNPKRGTYHRNMRGVKSRTGIMFTPLEVMKVDQPMSTAQVYEASSEMYDNYFGDELNHTRKLGRISSYLANLAARGHLEKVKPGVYKLRAGV